MRILPVLDLQRGVVVRAVRGRRSEYRPLQSALCASCRPLEVALALRSRFGFQDLYLADLDAIAGGPPALAIYRALLDQGFQLWVDPGASDRRAAESVMSPGLARRLVVGSETLASVADLRAMLRDWGEERILFSLDMYDGRPIARCEAWRSAPPESVLADALAAGVDQVLLLDLARVGAGEGVGAEALARRALGRADPPEIYVGGGVRGPSDLQALERLGVAGVLVASALHDGRLQPTDLDWPGRRRRVY
jgi:phosphoribosylformimino-5-aminoimidazole carboxamide ribotide isomerase